MKVMEIWEKNKKVYIKYKLTKNQLNGKGFWRKGIPCFEGYMAIHDVDKWIIGHYNGGGLQFLKTIKIDPKALTVIQVHKPFTKKETNTKEFAKKFIKAGRSIESKKDYVKKPYIDLDTGEETKLFICPKCTDIVERSLKLHKCRA